MHMFFYQYGVLRAIMVSIQLISKGSCEPAHMHNLVSYSDTWNKIINKICGHIANCVRFAFRYINCHQCIHVRTHVRPFFFMYMFVSNGALVAESSRL